MTSDPHLLQHVYRSARRIQRWKKRRRWTFSIQSLFFLVFLSAITFWWVQAQRRAFRLEHRAATLLANDYSASLYCDLTASSSVPQWDLAQVRYGRLFTPITYAYVADTLDPQEAVLDEAAWTMLQSLKSLEDLWIQECHIPRHFVFSYFSHLSDVTIIDSLLTEEQLASIGRLLKLESLTLANVGLTDDSLKALSHLTGLTRLSLLEENITDAVIPWLDTLSELKKLQLSGTKVTGDILSGLHCQKSLTVLHLTETLTDDKHMQYIVRFRALQQLSLSGTRVTDAGIEYLSRMNELQYLNLSNTDISDNAIAELSHLGRVKVINLSGTNVSDACIPSLLKMPSLNGCILSHTKMSQEGKQELSRHLSKK